LDEFGQMPSKPSNLETQIEEPLTSPQSPRPKLSIDTDYPTGRSSSHRHRRSNPPSPLPFSNYNLGGVGEEVQANVGRTSYEHAEEVVVVERREEKNEAGCCRCVVM